jgi:hypothetical protein
MHPKIRTTEATTSGVVEAIINLAIKATVIRAMRIQMAMNQKHIRRIRVAVVLANNTPSAENILRNEGAGLIIARKVPMHLLRARN